MHVLVSSNIRKVCSVRLREKVRTEGRKTTQEEEARACEEGVRFSQPVVSGQQG